MHPFANVLPAAPGLPKSHRRRPADATFNDLGQDGWESCGDLPGAVVFKRPKL